MCVRVCCVYVCVCALETAGGLHVDASTSLTFRYLVLRSGMSVYRSVKGSLAS